MCSFVWVCSSPLSGLESATSHHSELGSSASLSYGIASLIADKHPSSHKSHSSSSSSSNSSSQAEVSVLVLLCVYVCECVRARVCVCAPVSRSTHLSFPDLDDAGLEWEGIGCIGKDSIEGLLLRVS